MSRPQCSEVLVVPPALPLGMPVWCLGVLCGKSWLSHTFPGLITQYLVSRKPFTLVPGQGNLGGMELLHMGSGTVGSSRSLGTGNRAKGHLVL